MTNEDWEELGVQAHGLPPDLHVPVAAADLDAIEAYVGVIRERVRGRRRPVNAVVVEPNRPDRGVGVPLWCENDSDRHFELLHPPSQLWVHVDFAGYRNAWKSLDIGPLSSDVFLDHIRNREAIRLAGYRHPFLRLCPVSRATNTSGGLNNGAEGMEKEVLRSLELHPVFFRHQMERALAAPVILADPIDLTKMLDVPPGLTELQGVSSMLKKFYA